MKKCEEIRELLSFYLDNELHENDRKQVVKHLEGCDKCKAELSFLKNMIEAIGEIEEVEMPEDFGSKLHEKLIEAQKESSVSVWKNKKNIFKWASTAAAGFVLLLVAFNNSYLDNLTNNSKVAYVNDANLNMVGKQAMENNMERQKIAQTENVPNHETNQTENIQTAIQPAADSKAEVNNKAVTSVSKATSSIPASVNVAGKEENKITNPTTQNNTQVASNTPSNITNNASNTMLGDMVGTAEIGNVKSLSPSSQFINMSLTVSDMGDSISKLNNAAKANGGSMQGTQEVWSIFAANDMEPCTLTVKVPASTYGKFIEDVEKIGTLQLGGASAENKIMSEGSNTALGASQTEMVTVKITMQKK